MQTLRFFAIGFVVVIAAVSAGCTKDRLTPATNGTLLPPIDTDIQRGDIVINEFMVSGSTFQNEFGVPSDWIELFNPAFIPFTLESGSWYISDDAYSNPRKYLLPEITLPGRGYIIIWCDNADVVANDIHTNFALSSAGEDLGLYFAVNETVGILVDDYAYGEHPSGQSEGRTPDGGPEWIFYTLPTPGETNN